MIQRALVAVGLVLTTAMSAHGQNARLHGTVTSEQKPVAGATVMVCTAFPIKGPAYYCPSCYRDCGKSVVTSDDGSWLIEGLDNTLKFTILVIAKDHIPQKTKTINPQAGEKTPVDLKARAIESIPKEQLVQGRVLDTSGDPVAHAVVSPTMVWDTKGSGCGGACEGLDALAVTDENGWFALAYSKPTRAMDLEVAARGFATACFTGRAAGGKQHELRIAEGGSVSGRLVRSGTPVSNVDITLMTDQTRYGACVARQVIATGKNGEFLFANVLPGQKYTVAVATAQLKEGCVAPAFAELKVDGAEASLGELQVVKGVRLSGKVAPPPGVDLPEGAKITLGSQSVWDSITLELEKDGSFAFPEVFPGKYTLNVTAPGLYVSHRNISANKRNLNSLDGTIEADMAGLVIEMTREKPVAEERGDPKTPAEMAGIEKKAAK